MLSRVRAPTVSVPPVGCNRGHGPAHSEREVKASAVKRHEDWAKPDRENSQTFDDETLPQAVPGQKCDLDGMNSLGLVRFQCRACGRAVPTSN